jgi:hypothetical protein
LPACADLIVAAYHAHQAHAAQADVTH